MFGKKKKRQVLRIEKGQWAQIWESFKQNKLAMISMVVLLLIVLGALSADLHHPLADGLRQRIQNEQAMMRGVQQLRISLKQAGRLAQWIRGGAG
mgnify:CR=1 FL=1